MECRGILSAYQHRRATSPQARNFYFVLDKSTLASKGKAVRSKNGHEAGSHGGVSAVLARTVGEKKGSKRMAERQCR